MTSFRSVDVGLARQPRHRRQAPRAIEQVVLVLRRRRQRIEAFPHDDVAGRARARFLAGVLDLDRLSSRLSRSTRRGRLEGLALGAELRRAAARRSRASRYSASRQARRRAAGQRACDAAVHAAGGELVGGVVQRADRGAQRTMRRRPRGAAASVGERGVDRRAFGGVEQIAVGAQRCPRRVDDALGLDLRLGQRARRHVVVGVGERFLQHARDLGVGQPVGGLDGDRAPRRRWSVSRADTDSRPSASTWKVTRMRAAPATIGGMPRSSKRASERQSATRSRSPCTHVDAPSPSGRP